MKNIFCIKASVILLLGIMAFPVDALTVQLFGDSLYPFQNNVSGEIPCYVDIALTRPHLINQQLQGRLQINRAQVIHQYQSDFSAISHAMMCLVKAKQFGIQQLPAIVFNHHYVVYGVTNVAHAVKIFKHAEAAHRV